MAKAATVTLVISEDADTHFDFTYSAVADAGGNISNAEFAPIQNEIFQHFGKKFYLAAARASPRSPSETASLCQWS